MRSYLVLEETFVGLLDPLREVGKEGKARHGSGELHDVLNLDILTLGGWRRSGLDDGQHDLVELVRRDTLATTLVDLLYLLEYLEDTLLRQCRDEDNREVCEGG